MPEWTKQQEHAIFDQGGSLLVSAAAGSGKTAVLVERVIQKLINKEDPVDADRLLVVTFTNAAAAEMRDRISAKLSSLSGDAEYEKIIEKQMVLIDKANICTIDSFCIKLVRENFNLLGISPDFRIADESEIKILQASAMQETLDTYYKKDDSVFLELCELLNSFRDDSALVETVFSLYGFMRSHPFCRDWLTEKLAQYENSLENVSQSIWAKTLYPICADALKNAIAALDFSIEQIGDDPILIKKLYDVFDTKRNEVSVILSACETENLDEIFRAVNSISFPSFPIIRNYDDPERLELIKTRFGMVKDICKSLGEVIVSDAKGFRDDLVDLLPKIKKLFEITLDFTDRLDKIKREKNLVDFADTEQFALQLLLKKERSGYERTELAIQLSESFDEILIDECQDSNEAQDLIFKAVSKNERNMFLVGDVKQSIYRFRQAMPELFLMKKDRFSQYNGSNYPATINLSKNFRSRFEVTSAVNFFFDQLMSKGMGGIDYTEERLICGASYEQGEGYESELAMLEVEKGDDRNAVSASYIAQRIKEMAGTLIVTEKGILRPARYGDFCILLRAPKNIAHIYIKELEKEGIPACFQETPGLLESIEVSILIALLRVIDNPTLDIDMLTVLYSDLFGFTTDDITKLRLIDRKAPIYKLIHTASKGEDCELAEKSSNLIEVIEELRRVCATVGVAGLIDYIYRILNLPEFFSIKYKNPSKAVNLSIFRGFAEGFEKSELCSLSAFLRRIDRMKDTGAEIKGAPNSQSSGSMVQIMSIHHSKGLEYPVCFISDLARKFNKRDIQTNTALHSSMGFACVRRDEQKHTESLTIPLVASRVANEEAMLSEELRMLYVAMTRAKEKLILVTTDKDPIKEIQKCADKVLSTSSVISPYSVKSCASFSQWILMCASRHPEFSGLLNMSLSRYTLKNTECSFKITLSTVADKADKQVEEIKISTDTEKVKRLVGIINKNLTTSYKHEQDTVLPTKLSVSEISKPDVTPSLKKPDFSDTKELTAAQKGTAIHTFMQFADYNSAKENLLSEIERLVEQRFITRRQADAIDVAKLQSFFGSSLADSIFEADKVYREFRFMMPAKAGELFSDTDSDEEIMVQGVADCIIQKGSEFVILDYKSDAVNCLSVLKDRYQKQLSLYKEAITNLFEASSVRCVIYSFTLGDYIEV